MFVSPRHSFFPTGGLLASVALLPAIAAAQTNPEQWEDKQEIIVTAPSMAGSVAIPIPADVVLWDGDPLEGMSGVTDVWIDGVKQPLSTRQTRLRDRYLIPNEGALPNAYDR